MPNPIRFASFFVGMTLTLGASSCAPRVILLDRQTVLEEEAAGDWPDFEARLRDSAKVAGAEPFPSVDQSAAKRRRATVLNGESTTAATTR
jgi:hypothetical protein